MDKNKILKDENNSNYISMQSSYSKYKTKNINNDLISFFYQFNHLKNIYRQGWLKGLLDVETINDVESIADHSWSVAMLAISVIEKYRLEYDITKCMKLAIVHEIGEVYAGDFTPRDNVSKDKKHELEKDAVKRILSSVSFENDFYEVWEEFEKQETKESIFIKQLDKLECMMQASCYNLDISYMKSSIENITLPFLKEIVDELIRITKENDMPYCLK